MIDEDADGAERPCPLCGKNPHEQLCTACPSTTIPHLRHDLDPQLIGDKTGTCPLCAGKSFMPEGKGDWDSCACGLAKGHTEERMRAFVREMKAEMFGGAGGDEDEEGEVGLSRGSGGSGRGRERVKDGEVRGRRTARE